MTRLAIWARLVELVLVAEVKWRPLSVAERKKVLRQLESKWSHCSLRAKHPRVRLEVFDTAMLAA